MTNKMNPEIKKLWVDALRSGDYEQTTRRLTDGERYCCLGVLCDLAVKAGEPIRVRSDHGDIFYDNASATPPRAVWEWAGLSGDNPMVSVVNEDTDLSEYEDSLSIAEANDRGLTFEDIAELIESHF